jgi:hypothetical protein
MRRYSEGAPSPQRYFCHADRGQVFLPTVNQYFFYLAIGATTILCLYTLGIAEVKWPNTVALRK